MPSLFSLGSHTGHIQSLGGLGDPNYGGSGAGGRIALYHASHYTIPPFRGAYDTYGGRGNSGTGAEAGASGTAYILNTTSEFSTVQIDNNGEFIRDEHYAINNEGYRLDFTIPETSYSTSTSYTSTTGHSIKSSSSPYTNYRYYWYYCFYRNGDSTSYLVMNLFDQTFEDERHQYFMASSSSATITTELSAKAFVTKLKLYPTKSFPSKFKVSRIILINIMSFYLKQSWPLTAEASGLKRFLVKLDRIYEKKSINSDGKQLNNMNNPLSPEIVEHKKDHDIWC